MKETKRDMSRRKFISAGAVMAAVPSILAIETRSATEGIVQTSEASAPMVDLPVTTEAVQTLINKTIPSRSNTLGTDYVNVREFPITGGDITSALNTAILSLTSSPGGQILIPHGIWTTSGGHDINSSISIEGVGFNGNPGIWGTELKLNSGGSSFVFRVTAGKQNCGLKNLSIDMRSTPDATGLRLTNYDDQGNITGGSIHLTSVENVGFNHGAYGIKVDSKIVSGASTNFECIVNRFERMQFIGCKTAFYCNSVNGGYSFDTCVISLPAAGTAFDCEYMGNLSVEHSLIVGNQVNGPWIPATDGTTILKTFGGFNNISFYDCQDENVEFAYRNATNFYDYIPVVFRNCVVQSKFKYTASGAVVFDCCRIGVANGFVAFEDSPTAYVRVYLKGTHNFYSQSLPAGANFSNFVNPNSQIIYESTDVGLPEIIPLSTIAPYFVINKTRGAVTIPSGTAYIGVYNNLVTPNSLVFAQLRTFDPGGARIREVQSYGGYLQINLTQNAATNLSVAFSIEG